MTTDDFEQALEDRTDELWPYAPSGPLSPAKSMDRRIGFRLGALWARDRLTAQDEPTEQEVEAAARMITLDISHFAAPSQDGYRIVARDALRAALRARHQDGPDRPASLEQRIRDLHAADADGNCSHCTRGRVYAVPAPCETVRALAGGGEER